MIYLASPYSHDDPAVRLERFEAVCRFAAGLMRSGLVVFSPIAHTHPIAISEDGLPKGWEFWERFDREFLEAADSMVVLMLDGWEESVGVQAEILIAEELELPVEFATP